MQASVFGKHKLGIPYQPIAELLAKYRVRDPDKRAIVDLDSFYVTFGDLERITTDIAADLKRRPSEKAAVMNAEKKRVQ